MYRSLWIAVLALLLFLGFLSPFTVQAAEVPKSSNSFTDVPADHPDRTYILYLADRKVINGYPGGRFGPGDTLDRAAAAKISIQLAGLAALSNGKALDFTDLPASHWSVPYVRAGVEGGLVKGFGDKSFRPNEPLTRAQLAALAIRALRQPTDRLPTMTLSDVKPSDWFYQPVLLAVAAGLIDAPNGNFRPNDVVTRGEAARSFAKAMVYTPLGANTPMDVIVTPRSGKV